MKQVIIEYSGIVVAIFGSISFFVIIGRFLLSKEGLLAYLILNVLGGL